MTPLTAKKPTTENQIDYSEKDSFDALYHELAKGVQSMKNGEVYMVLFPYNNDVGVKR